MWSAKDNLTLKKAIEVSVSMEMAEKEAHQFSSTGRVHKVLSEPKGARNGTCYRCGKMAASVWSWNAETVAKRVTTCL